METSISLDQLAVLFSVMLALFCVVGMVLCYYLCLNTTRARERGAEKLGRSWFRNVSGTVDLDDYYTDDLDGYGLGLAGLRGQAALNAADTHSSCSSSDISKDISQFIWERRQTARYSPPAPHSPPALHSTPALHLHPN